MPHDDPSQPQDDKAPSIERPNSALSLATIIYGRALHAPLSNYTLSSVCPNCDAPTVRRACKVRCDRCGFMWDCSEL